MLEPRPTECEDCGGGIDPHHEATCCECGGVFHQTCMWKGNLCRECYQAEDDLPADAPGKE